MRRAAAAAAVVLVLVVSVPVLGLARGAARPAPGASPAASGGVPVARVGQLVIGSAELDRNEQEAHRLYRDRNHAEMAPELTPLVRRQVLENLIRQRLLTLEAHRGGVTVSDAEAEAQIKMNPAFQQNGMFNEARYLATKAANPAGFAQALAANREMLIVRKIGARMDQETEPDRAAIRVEVERELARASIDYLALRGREFESDDPQPREADVVAAYRAHPERYRRPEEVVLSLVAFNRPAPSDSSGATDAGYRAWEARMRGRADSAMTALRAGARFEDLGLLNGGVRTLTLRRAGATDVWRGGPRDVAAAFAAAPGTVLADPVRVAPGWALVRVDEHRVAGLAPLREVSPRIRAELKAALRARRDEQALAELYQAARDSLRGPGYPVRYALADSASFPPGEPSRQDLDRFYRAHLADYSSYQRSSGEVVATPFIEVEDEIRHRWAREKSRELARVAAEGLRDSWTRGRRDPALERSMTLVRDLGMVPASGDPDTGRAAAALATALTMRRGEPGVWSTPVGGGFLVVSLGATVPDYLPTLAQARPQLLERLAARRQAEDERAALRMYQRDTSGFRTRAVVHFSRLLIEPPDPMQVELTHDEVERYFRAHLNQYSVEELVHVRHILIGTSGPGALSDAEARAKAEKVLARVRAGEDFARLAAELSDDPATKLSGGDVGTFRRGQMREAFERAAFEMRPGDISGPVRTEVGYHVLECLEYLPPIIPRLVEVYANVAYDCARAKAVRIAGDRADSLYRTLKSVAQAKAVASRLHLDIMATDYEVGTWGSFDNDLRPYIRKIETMKPGELYPGTQLYVGLGVVISWVDAIDPPRRMAWDNARQTILDQYRRERAKTALEAKRDELDSLAAAGWSFDSLTALWGGGEHLGEAELGDELRGMGGRALLDSLVFGGQHPPVLEPGRPSGWIQFPGGLARLELVERMKPDPEELNRRAEKRAQVVKWRNMKAYFDRLKARYPVEILDGELRATALAEPTES